MVALQAERNLTEDNPSFTEAVQIYQARMYAFSVPATPAVISIGTSLKLGDVNANKASMFLAQAQNASTSTSNSGWEYATGVQSWSGSEGKVLNSSSIFCPAGCTFWAVIVVQTGSSITFDYSLTREKSVLPLYARVTDVAVAGNKNCYIYNVPASSKSLAVYLRPFGGNALVAANPVNCPADPANFAFASMNGSYSAKNSLFTISPSERTAVGDYCVCVFPQSSAGTFVYELIIKMEDWTKRGTFLLDSSVARTMGAEKDELLVFEADFNGITTGLSYTLTLTKGSADFYEYYCSYDGTVAPWVNSSCVMTAVSLNSSVVVPTASTKLEKAVDLSRSSCTGTGLRCGYMLGIYGKNSTRLTISAEDATRKVQSIDETTPFFGRVETGETLSYTFGVSDSSLANLTVSLSLHMGVVNMTVEKLDGSNAAVKNGSGRYTESVTFASSTDGALNGNYRINVTGKTPATFTLAYTTATTLASPVALFNGVTQRTTLGSVAATFAFGVSIKTTLKDDLLVQFVPVAGAFNVQVAGRNLGYCSAEQCNASGMATNSSDLLVCPENVSESYEGEYTVKVSRWNVSDLSTVHVFDIKYVTGLQTIRMFDDFAENATLAANESAYYKYYVSDLEDNVKITLAPRNGTAQLLVSTNSSNKLPSISDRDYSLICTASNSVSIPVSQSLALDPACGALGSLDSACAIYMRVLCLSSQCNYSLTASVPETPVPEPFYEGLSTLTLICIIVGGVVALVVVVAIICCCCCKKKAEITEFAKPLRSEQKELKDLSGGELKNLDQD